MIATFHDVQSGSFSQFVDYGFEQREIGEGVTRALQEKHGDCDSAEVIPAFGPGLTRCVQGETHEYEASHSGKSLPCRRLGGHPTTHRFSTHEER